jgi:DNA-binding response OmpR family regulator
MRPAVLDARGKSGTSERSVGDARVPSILVIEDEARVTSLLVRALTDQGFDVDFAHDGARGLELAERGDFDIVLLDLLLPKVSGVSVLQRILASRPEQAVLVLSAVSDAVAKVSCLKLGACDYMAKPFSLAELVERIRMRLREPAACRGERVLRIGQATLDLDRRTLDLGQGPVGLSAREFLLLHHLMSRAGEICTRETLLSDVWGFSFDPQSTVVEVYVARLRAKLGSEIIETVRNVGYGFNAAWAEADTAG